jgi:hypothetical protein
LRQGRTSSATFFQQLENGRRRVAGVPTPILSALVVLGCALAALTTTPQARAESTGSRLGKPPPLEAVPEAAPELADEEWTRRAWLLEASAGPALGLCPGGDTPCNPQIGLNLSALVQSRPVPFFSWGPFFNRVLHQERFNAPQWTLNQSTTAWALGLAGRLWLNERGRVDPYLQVAAGLGSAMRSGQVESETPTRFLATSGRDDGQAVPLYAVSAGASVQASSEIRVGAEFGWSHWLYSPWEQCPVLTGICVNPPLRAYDPHNGVLSLSLSVGLSFGSRL